MGSIVFRSAGGTKLWGANAFRPAALEIDGYDPVREEAWSVVARGETEVMTSAEEKAAVDALHLEPWQPGAKDNYIRLRPRALTGRRFKVNKPDVWNTPADRRQALLLRIATTREPGRDPTPARAKRLDSAPWTLLRPDGKQKYFP